MGRVNPISIFNAGGKFPEDDRGLYSCIRLSPGGRSRATRPMKRKRDRRDGRQPVSPAAFALGCVEKYINDVIAGDEAEQARKAAENRKKKAEEGDSASPSPSWLTLTIRRTMLKLTAKQLIESTGAFAEFASEKITGNPKLAYNIGKHGNRPNRARPSKGAGDQHPEKLRSQGNRCRNLVAGLEDVGRRTKAKLKEERRR